MKKRILVLWTVAILLLGGCTGGVSRDSVNSRMVTHITVHDHSGSWEYTAPEKVRLLLLALRSLGPDFPARTDVNALTGEELTIRLHCADGSTAVYRIRNGQYLQKNEGPWRKISEKKTQGFWQMVQQLPPDEAQAVYSAPFPITAARGIRITILGRRPLQKNGCIKMKKF